jgi:transposase
MFEWRHIHIPASRIGSIVVAMFALSENHRYFFFNQSTDMRKSFDALSGIILNLMNRNPLSGEVYIFVNRGRNRIKILQWQKDGFVLYYKRLESGCFAMPETIDAQRSISLSWLQLVMLVEGVQMQKTIKKKRYVRE